MQLTAGRLRAEQRHEAGLQARLHADPDGGVAGGQVSRVRRVQPAQEAEGIPAQLPLVHLRVGLVVFQPIHQHWRGGPCHGAVQWAVCDQ